MKKLIVLCLMLSGCAGYRSVNLQGLTTQQVQRRLGEPTIQRTESPYQLWTYKQSDCSLLVYFDENGLVKQTAEFCP